MMRSAIRAGFQTPDEVIDDYLPHEFSKELIETWVAKYLRALQALLGGRSIGDRQRPRP